MIHVYEYNSLPDDYQSLNEGPIECSDFPALLHEDIPRNSRLHHILRDGIPLSSHWKPLRTEYSLTEKPLPDGDFPSIAVPAAVFSERAWDVLRPLIGGVVEALSIIHPNGKPHLLINVLDIVDCLDIDHCETNKDSSDPHSRISAVFKYAFRENMIEGKHIFKAPEMAGLAIYVSAEFKRVVEENGLRGLAFRQLYPHVPRPNAPPVVMCISERPLEANDLQSLENYRKLGRAKLKLEEYGPNPGDIVQTLESRVDTWRQMAEADLTFYDRMPPTGAAAGAIGVHWADQFVRQFGWEWACLVIDNNQESPSISVVSPDRAYALHPVSFVYLLLTLPHLDNTLLLIFNMAKDKQLPPSHPNAYLSLTKAESRHNS